MASTLTDDILAARRETEFVAEQIRKAQREGLHGRLVVVMERGHIRRIIKEESILPPKEDGGS